GEGPSEPADATVSAGTGPVPSPFRERVRERGDSQYGVSDEDSCSYTPLDRRSLGALQTRQAAPHMKQLLIIGIGAGDPEYLTVQAINAMNRADVFFLLDKGASKQPLLQLRRDILQRYVTHDRYRLVEAHSPERVREGDYAGQVHDLNRAKQQVFERLIERELQDGQCGAFLVWGDPSLYDSTLRILDAIQNAGRL
ncbi:precorrin-6A synthase (deacetylating), partial [Escherichia coli]